MIDSAAREASGDLEVERMYSEVRQALFGAMEAPLTLGRYEIADRLGQGAMGTVYAGHDAQLGRKVAIKILRSDAAGSVMGPRARARLLREAQAMARVSSPFVVAVYEAGAQDDRVYVAMEHVEGQTLTSWLNGTQPAWREICKVFLEAGKGLAAVHGAGLVHRDFKPDNVLVAADGHAKVADFGLAAAVGHREAAPFETDAVHGIDTRLTRTGVAAGSLAYMSPEQHRCDPADARSDQFAFCVALFEALLNAHPFPSSSAKELRAKVLAGGIEWPRFAPSVPDRVLRVLRRGLQLEPADRCETMLALVDQLQRATERSHWWRWLAAAAIGGGLMVPVGLAFSDEDPCDGDAARVENAWSDARRAQIADGLRATKTDFADDTADQVTARFDDYIARWSGVRAQACAANHAPARRVLTLACLDHGLSEMAAIGEVLASDPARSVQYATLAAYKLQDPEVCLDEPTTVLRYTAATDRAQVAARGRVWTAVSGARARLLTGDMVEGAALAERGVALARELGEPGTIAEALLIRGTIAARTGRLDASESDLFEAAALAESVGNPELLARARTELVVVIGYRQGRIGEGFVWADLAEAALQRAGRHGLLKVRLLNARGLVHRAGGELDAARASLESALRLAREVLEHDHPGLASTLVNLAAVDAEDGRIGAARERLVEALAIRNQTLGAAHPDTRRTSAALHDLR